LPFRGGKAPIAAIGRCDRCGIAPGLAGKRRLPQRSVQLEVPRLKGGELGGVDAYRLQRTGKFAIGRDTQRAEEILQEGLCSSCELLGRRERWVHHAAFR